MDDEMKSEFQLLAKVLDQLLAKQEKFSQLIAKLALSEATEMADIEQIIAYDVVMQEEIAGMCKLIK
jgi:hypothetical protein